MIYQIRAFNDPARRCVSLYVHRQAYVDGELVLRTFSRRSELESIHVDEVTFDLLNGRESYVNPTFPIEFEQAQQLMDDLWAAGLRPIEGAGSAGQLAATEAHVGDLRKLLFHHVGISDAQA